LESTKGIEIKLDFHILESTKGIEIKLGTYIDVNKRMYRRQEPYSYLTF